MAETIISTSECAWKDVSIQILGTKLTGLRGFTLKTSSEKEHVFASGDDPVDIVKGNNKYEGSLKLLKYEYDKIIDAVQAAGYSRLIDVPHPLVTVDVQYKKTLSSVTRLIAVLGVAFTDVEIGMEQGAKMTEISLPFLCMRIIETKK